MVSGRRHAGTRFVVFGAALPPRPAGWTKFRSGPGSGPFGACADAAKCAFARNELFVIKAKVRVLSTSSEFHFGRKQATTLCREQGPAGMEVRSRRHLAGSQFEGVNAGSNTQSDLVSAPEANPA